MDISIGIMAYNEENNIGNLLESILIQKTKTVNIKEIVVVSSGSTDNTNIIVKDYSKKIKRIRLIKQKNRVGKVSAINKFLKVAKSDILVLESADTIPGKNTIEKLCQPLKDKKIGIVASRPIPKNSKKDNLGFVVELQWLIHHKISLLNPKFGELIAFKRLFTNLDKNILNDEEGIGMYIKNKGFNAIYAPNAIVYNTGPKTKIDFIKQRRRVYCGHMELKKKYNYEVSTLSNFNIFKSLLKEINIANIFPIIFAILLEGYGRLLGIYDYYTNKNYYMWEIVRTTKRYD